MAVMEAVCGTEIYGDQPRALPTHEAKKAFTNVVDLEMDTKSAELAGE